MRYLSSLDLFGNILSESGCHLADTIESRGYNSHLHQLVLRGCAILEDVCGQIQKSLVSCRLTLLDLSYNTLSDAGQYLTQNITSSLKILHLRSCQMSQDVCSEFLMGLTSGGLPDQLDLSGNTLGEAAQYLSKYFFIQGCVTSFQSLGLDRMPDSSPCDGPLALSNFL